MIKLIVLTAVLLSACGPDVSEKQFYKQPVICNSNPSCICNVGANGQQTVGHCN